VTDGKNNILFLTKNINKILNKTLKKFINCYLKYNNISSTFHNNSKKKKIINNTMMLFTNNKLKIVKDYTKL